LRKKISRKAIIQTAIPLVLLTIFALVVSFPKLVPLLQIKHPSYKGIGTVTFTYSIDEKKTSSFNMKQVPAGVAPGGCTDVPGATRVDEKFLIGETEVTEGLWLTVAKRASQKGYVFYDKVRSNGKATLPAEYVSWRDAVVWCNALSEDLGLVPVYYSDESLSAKITSVLDLEKNGDKTFLNRAATGFRLPGTDEWELTARYIDGEKWNSGCNPSGSEKNYNQETWSAGYAVFSLNSMSPVKTLSPNHLGVYDMSGNVWEWCYDQFGGDETTSEGKRVVRGGSWIGNAYRLQIGGEFGTLPGALENGQGFRLAKSGWDK